MNPPCYVNPVVVVTPRELAKFKTIQEAHRDFQDRLRKVKSSIPGTWIGSDADLWVSGNYSRQPSLVMHVFRDSVDIWELRTGRSIKCFDHVPTDKDLSCIIEQVESGKSCCNKCGGWFNWQDMKGYSFAGVVCSSCFDPKQHLPPDTRGD